MVRIRQTTAPVGSETQPRDTRPVVEGGTIVFDAEIEGAAVPG